MKIWRQWKEVYAESKRSEDYVYPDFKFEWTVTEDEIKRFMESYNPNFKYFISSGGDSVEVIGKDEIEKHILIHQKKAEIRKLQEEIGEISI